VICVCSTLVKKRMVVVGPLLVQLFLVWGGLLDTGNGKFCTRPSICLSTMRKSSSFCVREFGKEFGGR
jgi:hypothetical protein